MFMKRPSEPPKRLNNYREHVKISPPPWKAACDIKEKENNPSSFFFFFFGGCVTASLLLQLPAFSTHVRRRPAFTVTGKIIKQGILIMSINFPLDSERGWSLTQLSLCKSSCRLWTGHQSVAAERGGKED